MGVTTGPSESAALNESAILAVTALVESLDAGKVLSGDNIRAVGMLVAKMGQEKTEKWALMHMLGQYFQMNITPNNPRDTAEVPGLETFMRTLSKDEKGFDEALMATKGLIADGTITDTYDDLLAKVIRPEAPSLSEDFVLYPAAFSAGFLLNRQKEGAMITTGDIDSIHNHVTRCIDGVSQIRSRLDPDEATSLDAELMVMRTFITEWVSANIPSVEGPVSEGNDEFSPDL